MADGPAIAIHAHVLVLEVEALVAGHERRAIEACGVSKPNQACGVSKLHRYRADRIFMPHRL